MVTEGEKQGDHLGGQAQGVGSLIHGDNKGNGGWSYLKIRQHHQAGSNGNLCIEQGLGQQRPVERYLRAYFTNVVPDLFTGYVE